MIVTLNCEEIRLVLQGQKRTDLVADPHNRWAGGKTVHLWSDWPFRDWAVPIATFRCTTARYAELVLRDNYCHLYLGDTPELVAPFEVIRFDSPDMERLAITEGYPSRDEFLSSYFPGWQYADPDEWQRWTGKMIFWQST